MGFLSGMKKMADLATGQAPNPLLDNKVGRKLKKSADFWTGEGDNPLMDNEFGRKMKKSADFWTGSAEDIDFDVPSPKRKKVKKPKPERVKTQEEIDEDRALDESAERAAKWLLLSPFKLVWEIIKLPYTIVKFAFDILTNLIPLITCAIVIPMAYYNKYLFALTGLDLPEGFEVLSSWFLAFIIIWISVKVARYRKFKKADQDETLPKTIKEFKKLARKSFWGNVHAQRKLGLCYLKGYGVNQDLYKAKILFQKAADKGSDSAKLMVGEGKIEGYCQWPDFTGGIITLEPFAKRGNRAAIKNLNRMLTIEGFDPLTWDVDYKERKRKLYHDLAYKYAVPEVVFEESVQRVELGRKSGSKYADYSKHYKAIKACAEQNYIPALEFMAGDVETPPQLQEEYKKKAEKLSAELAAKTAEEERISKELAQVMPEKYNKPVHDTSEQ